MSPKIDSQFMGRWISRNRSLLREILISGRTRKILNSWKRRITPDSPIPVVLFSQVAWDDVWQRPQEMALGLSEFRPVIFISPVQTHQPAGQLLGRWKWIRKENDGKLLVVSPLILSGEYRSSLIRALNRVILSRYLGPLASLKKMIFLTNSPFVGRWISRFSNASVGYDVIDDFCAFEWSPEDGRQNENQLIESSRFGFTGTWSLQEKYGNRLPGCEFLASGVDYEKFQKKTSPPEEFNSLPGRKILYIGTLNDRIDGKLIRDLANWFPGDSVILVGPRRQTFESLDYPKNVHFMGLKPHDELPSWYQHCDFGIMPFADNEAARAINPVKTLEYLACGLPLISTPIPDVERFYSEHVIIAKPGEWKSRIEKMLESETDDLLEKRRAFARNKSWKALCKKVEKKIRQSLDQSKPSKRGRRP